ncbi:hypothetical protein Dsin_006621 [Dipteronia sinensis]|uniref:Ubiquitin-like protease family profile domain-containing protein n=1 Tax=Dipteronia sinensis TaxID=43782 RepID=A0AAE0B092_9ROSI|nr:hypothetical protein Dsin_006621 [Dipteronia sinensis]
MLKCMLVHGQVDTTTQTQLQQHPDGSITPWRYDPAHARDCLEVSDRIDRFRDVISWIGSSNPRLREFGRHCTLNGLRPQRFQTDMSIIDIRNKLFEVFNIYEPRFGGVNTQPSVEPETQPIQTSWSILKRQKKDKSSSSSSVQRSDASSGAELNRYLEAQLDACEDMEKFDLLLWWKTYSYSWLFLALFFIFVSCLVCLEGNDKKKQLERLPHIKSHVSFLPGILRAAGDFEQSKSDLKPLEVDVVELYLIPQQHNKMSCGVFIMKYMENIVQDKCYQMNFTADDMKDIRSEIV